MNLLTKLMITDDGPSWGVQYFYQILTAHTSGLLHLGKAPPIHNKWTYNT